jgi:hypothetical protein
MVSLVLLVALLVLALFQTHTATLEHLAVLLVAAQ